VKSVAGAAGVAPFAWSSVAWTRERPAPRIAIIGAGIAGLNAVYRLKKAGYHASVYEARRRIGGRILSLTGAVGEGLVTDLGGSFINTDHEDMLGLAREFGLKLFSRIEDAKRFPFPPAGYFFDGRIRTETEIAEALRPFARQITRDADALDRDYEATAPRLDRLSVQDYLDGHAEMIPAPLARALLECSIRAEYGVELAQSSALQLVFNFPTVEGNRVEVLGGSDEAFVVEGGCGRIVQALAGMLPGQIHEGHVLVRLEATDHGFRLTFRPERIVEADYVILAIPFMVLREVDLDVELPETLRRFINAVDLGRNEKLFAGFRTKVWRREDGFVQDFWTDLGFSSAWDATQRQTDRADGALTLFFGGDETAEALSGSAKEQGISFVERLNRAIPGAQEAATGAFLRTRWSQEPFTRGSYVNFRPGQLTAFSDFLYIDSADIRERQDVHVGNLVFAGEHLSDAFSGFMNGAAETGRLAANVVLRRLRQAERPLPEAAE
jgi:monoamine oxidase